MRKLTVVLVIWLIMAVAVGAIGCSGKASPTSTPEPTIPANFTTYTNDAGIFSISYPQDWEAPLDQLADLNQGVNDYLSSINSDLSIGKAYTLFIAGLPIEAGLSPSVNVVAEPNSAGLSTLKSVLEGETQGLKSYFTGFQELSQADTTVGGQQAVILEWKGSLPNAGEVHDLQMFLLKGKTIWTVTCAATPENYGDSENTFHNILSSFRILK